MNKPHRPALLLGLTAVGLTVALVEPAAAQTANVERVLQSIVEVRHKDKLPSFLRQMKGLIAEGGLLVFCDHYSEAGSGKHPDLYLAKAEQPKALAEAGFAEITMHLDKGGMALFSAVPIRST